VGGVPKRASVPPFLSLHLSDQLAARVLTHYPALEGDSEVVVFFPSTSYEYVFANRTHPPGPNAVKKAKVWVTHVAEVEVLEFQEL
jgi:hypothetical protein